MARRPQVSAVSDGVATGVVIDVPGQEPIMITLHEAEDVLIQLGGIVNTFKGVRKKLPLRDRLRILRG
jgi:hypothetical protein